MDLELLIKHVLTDLIYNFKGACPTKISMKSFEFLGQFDLKYIYHYFVFKKKNKNSFTHLWVRGKVPPKKNCK